MPLDKEKADGAVKFIRLLRHVKGKWAGQPFVLEKWQEKIIRDVFGTVTKDGKRQFRTVYLEVPRKNGKSILSAAIALYLLFMDREPGAEIYAAAGDREQASLVFNMSAQMVRSSPALAKKCKIVDSQKRIVYYDTNSFYRAIPAEASGAHGFNAHGVIYDELHVAPNRDLYDALTTSRGAREQPLLVMITTAGYDRESICWEQHEYARKILTGTIKDPSFYACIYAADEEDDWNKVATWKKANPNLDVSISREFLKQEARRAEELLSFQNTFRRLYLNQWTQQHSRWIDLGLWDEQAGTVVEEQLAGRTCYGGLDLSSVSDITAWVLAFPSEDDPELVDVLCRFWVPADRLHDSSNKYRDAYKTWARQGFLKTTPGGAVDYQFVKAQILADAKKFNVVDLNIDRLFQGYQLGMELMDELGENKVLGMGQGFLSMAVPMKEFEKRLLARKIRHGGNPVLRWMADNVSVKQDPAGNLKPDKSTSQGKIDGIVALIMSLDRLSRYQETSKAGLFVL